MLKIQNQTDKELRTGPEMFDKIIELMARANGTNYLVEHFNLHAIACFKLCKRILEEHILKFGLSNAFFWSIVHIYHIMCPKRNVECWL